MRSRGGHGGRSPSLALSGPAVWLTSCVPPERQAFPFPPGHPALCARPDAGNTPLLTGDGESRRLSLPSHTDVCQMPLASPQPLLSNGITLCQHPNITQMARSHQGKKETKKSWKIDMNVTDKIPFIGLRSLRGPTLAPGRELRPQGDSVCRRAPLGLV